MWPCSSSPKPPILTSCPAHLAHGTILLASLWLMQNPAPPVANQKCTDFWRETAEKINGRGSDDTILPEMGMLEPSVDARINTALLSPQTPDCCPEEGLASSTAWILTSSYLERPNSCWQQQMGCPRQAYLLADRYPKAQQQHGTLPLGRSD